MKRLITLLALAALIATSSTALAAYPSKPIKILTQAAPGAIIDTTTRQLAAMLSEELGVSIVVSNHPGAGGNVATNMLLAAKPDGYTLCTTGSGPFADNFFGLQVRYKFDDLAPISLISISRMGIITQPDAPWNTIQEAFQAAKKEGRPLKAAVMDTRAREVLEFVAKQEGAQVSPVPQQGGTPVLTAVMGKHVDIGIVGSILVDNTKAGKIKTLAVVGADRMSQMPHIPTLKEEGYDISADSAVVLFASSKVPADIINTLSDAMEKVSKTQKYEDIIIKAMNAEAVPAGQDAAKQLLKEYYNILAREKGTPEI